MIRDIPARRRAVVLGVLLAAASFAGACREALDGGQSCLDATGLCPGQTLEIRDTIINPVLEFDSTYAGFPSIGAEFELPLVNRPEIETRAIIRFDTLATYYAVPNDTNHTITHLDSTRLRIILNRTSSVLPDSVRFEVYDVDDSTAADTATTPILNRFVPAFRLGSKTFAKAQVIDTMFIPVSDSAILKKITDSATFHGRARLGIKVSGTGPVSVRMETEESGSPAFLGFRPTLDTIIKELQNPPANGTPTDRVDFRRDLLDYSLVARTTIVDAPGTMNIGGLPGRRVYLRFNLPKRLTDSTTVIRATLRLTQRPLASGETTDSMSIYAHIVLATTNVGDNRRAASLIAPAGLIITDSIRVIPRDSGVKTLEMYDMVRTWAAQSGLPQPPPRAVVLRSATEGALPLQSTFYSTTAAAGLRPQMRLTYIPRVGFGVP